MVCLECRASALGTGLFSGSHTTVARVVAHVLSRVWLADGRARVWLAPHCRACVWLTPHCRARVTALAPARGPRSLALEVRI